MSTSSATPKRRGESKTSKRKGSKSATPKTKKSKMSPEPPQGSDAFHACEAFCGAKPGYSFKNGDSGLGYYKDTTPVKSARSATKAKKIKQRKPAVDADDEADDEADDVVKNSDFVSLHGGKNEKESTVLYLGHIPHGFYEEEMKTFFSQFGELVRLRLSRSKKTGRSRGYAFIEFGDIATAKTVALAMNKYILFGQTLVCHMMRPGKVHAKLFDGCEREFKVVPWRDIARDRHNKDKTQKQQKQNLKRLLRKDQKKKARLAKILGETGVEFAYSGYAEASAKMVGAEN